MWVVWVGVASICMQRINFKSYNDVDSSHPAHPTHKEQVDTTRAKTNTLSHRHHRHLVITLVRIITIIVITSGFKKDRFWDKVNKRSQDGSKMAPRWPKQRPRPHQGGRRSLCRFTPPPLIQTGLVVRRVFLSLRIGLVIGRVI